MKRGIKYLLFADSWASLAIGMIGPIYAIFVEQIGGDILDASWAYFTFMITSGVAMYLISSIEDKTKHKEKFVTLGYSLTALGCLSYIFVYNQATLLTTQIILGLSVAFGNPAYDALYSHYINKKEEASEWGSWEAMGYIVTAIAAIIGGYIASLFGFKTLFIIMFLASLLSIIISLNLFKDKKYLSS